MLNAFVRALGRVAGFRVDAAPRRKAASIRRAGAALALAAATVSGTAHAQSAACTAINSPTNFLNYNTVWSDTGAANPSARGNGVSANTQGIKSDDYQGTAAFPVGAAAFGGASYDFEPGETINITFRTNSVTQTNGAGFTGIVQVTNSPTSFTTNSSQSINAVGTYTATVNVTSTTSAIIARITRATSTNNIGSFTVSATCTPAAIAPIVTTQPSDQAVGAGGTASFTAAVSGSPASTVQWQVNGVDIPGATSPTYSFTASASDDNKQYRAVFTNSAATATTNAATLTVVAATSVAPTSGPQAGGTTVEINGTGFTTTSTVAFGVAAASSVTPVSRTLLRAIAPAGTGTVNVRVTTSGATSPTGSFNVYTYVPAPVVNALSPNAGPAAGGNQVTINGQNFTVGTTVRFGTADATNVTVQSQTQILATAPAAAPGQIFVTVTNANGTSATGNGNRYVYVAAPTVTSIAPSAGPTAGGTSVTITGTNLSGATAVTFGATAATNVAVANSNQITATAPAGTGTVDVRITTPGGTSATDTRDQFTYVPAPAVTGVTPNSGSTAGGTAITITGTNLSSASAVRIGGTAATNIVVVNNGQIDATTPAGTAGAKAVTVTTPGGTGTLANGYTYVAAPVISGLSPSPAEGPTAGGTSFIISGSGFTGVDPATGVQFGGTPATGVTVISDSQISGTTPAGAIGLASVTVTNAVGTSNNNLTFRYVGTPTANDQSVSTDFNTARSITLTGTDPNTPARTLTYLVATAPQNGTLSGTAPNLVYSPATNYVGSDSFTFTVNNGVSTSAPATVGITVAAPAAPAAPVVTAPANGSTTNDATPTVTGTTAAGSTVAIYFDGALSGGATVTGTSFNYTPSMDLGQGPHTVYAIASNAGGPSPQSSTNTFTVDSVAPAAPVITAPANGARTTERQPTISGTAEANSAITVSFDTSAGGGTTTANASGTWSFTATAALAFGTRTVSATARDAAGNVSPAAISSFTIVQVPVISSVTPASGSANGGTSVTISGSGFTGATAVSFGGTATRSFTVNGDTSITAITEARAPGGVAVSVTTAAGTGTSAPGLYTYAAPTATISPPSGGLPGGTVGVAYSQTFTTSGGTTAPYAYAVNGTLPTGLTLSTGGVLSGTPTGAGDFAFIVTSTDSSPAANGGPYQTTANYTLRIASPTIVVAPATLPGGRVGLAYSAQASASGGTAPYTYAVTAGALPAGLAVSLTGTISGTPTAGGTFNFTLTATDSSTGTGAPFSGSRSYTLTVAAPTITVAPAALPDATRNVAYSQALTASGGTAPYSFALTAGTLPPGLTLAADGTVSGTPSAQGSYTFTARATDSSTGSGPYAGTRSYTMAVAAPTITIAPASLPQATRNTAYSQTLTASGGTGPYTYAVTAGALPAGVTLSEGGTLSGTPSVQGSFNFTVTASDANRNPGSRGYTLVVAAPVITLAPTSLPTATVGVAYSQGLVATGGTAPYGFTLTSGTLPTGIRLSSGGTLSGTPTEVGSFAFAVRAADANGNAGTQSYTLVVATATITITPATLPGATVDTGYSQQLTASGGNGAYAFAVTAGSLPGGLVLSPEGLLSGTPDEEGNYTFTVTATEQGSDPAASGSREYTLAVTARAGGLARAWVSGVGDDAAPCTRTAPCKTFAGAFAKTATGGEIGCLDAGGYGAVTITRAMTIACGDRLGRAGIIAAGTDAITVAAPADARVVLSGLDLEGVGNSSVPGSNGIRVVGAGSVLVRNVTIRGFRSQGVAFQPSGAAQLDLVGVRIADTGSASDGTSGSVLVAPTGSGTMRVTVSRSQVANGPQSGIRLEGGAAAIAATIVDTTLTGNGGSALLASGNVQAVVANTTLTGNGTGVNASGGAAQVTLGASTVSRNATGIVATGGAQVRSAGGNILAGNTTDGTFNGTVAQQ